MAGIVGARVAGVAPAANLINVKIANNQRQANSKQVAQALLDIIAEHKANKAKLHPDFWDFRGSIINMSFGQIEDPMVLSSQVVAAEEAGIKIYASAGNNNIDAGRNRHYPCAYPGVSCIAAVDSSYRKTYFSNYGSVVDFLAPGE